LLSNDISLYFHSPKVRMIVPNICMLFFQHLSSFHIFKDISHIFREIRCIKEIYLKFLYFSSFPSITSFSFPNITFFSFPSITFTSTVNKHGFNNMSVPLATNHFIGSFAFKHWTLIRTNIPSGSKYVYYTKVPLYLSFNMSVFKSTAT